MSLNVLFSHTVILGLLFLVGVVAASYVGTTLALRKSLKSTNPNGDQ